MIDSSKSEMDELEKTLRDLYLLAIAEQIVTERQQRGEYKSLIDIKQRTGLPFTTYHHIA
ncbi:hypothetical protein [Nostoc sp.]|uniref:hypothetical protein n=1 Tax=Nostoc sp. TaxID=1180 RepID=UPI003FA52A56